MLLLEGLNMFLVPIKSRPFKFSSYLILIVLLVPKIISKFFFVGTKNTIKIK